MLDLQEVGCHNINLATPEHVVPQVVEALAVAAGDGLRCCWTRTGSLGGACCSAIS